MVGGICVGYACKAPVTTAARLAKLLDELPRRSHA